MIKLPERKVKKASEMMSMNLEQQKLYCSEINAWNACVDEYEVLNATVQPVSYATNDVLAERHRQQMVEGWTTKHDDQYQFNELAIAGGLYALNAHDSSPAHFKLPPSHWPWNAEWWKPKSPRKDLVRAAALIIAEIERIDRLAAAPGGQDS